MSDECQKCLATPCQCVFADAVIKAKKQSSLAAMPGYVAGVKIENGFEMPKVSKGHYERTGKWWRVFESMQSGDSFVLPKEQMNTVRNSARKLGVKIVIKHLGNQTWRIWKAT